MMLLCCWYTSKFNPLFLPISLCTVILEFIRISLLYPTLTVLHYASGGKRVIISSMVCRVPIKKEQLIRTALNLFMLSSPDGILFPIVEKESKTR